MARSPVPATDHRQALRVGDRIEISGQGGWDADFTLAAMSLEEEIVKACVTNVEKTLAVAGASLARRRQGPLLSLSRLGQ